MNRRYFGYLRQNTVVILTAVVLDVFLYFELPFEHGQLRESWREIS